MQFRTLRHHPFLKMSKKNPIAIDLTDESGAARHSGRPRRCLLYIKSDEDCKRLEKGSEELGLALELLKITIGKTREKAAEHPKVLDGIIQSYYNHFLQLANFLSTRNQAVLTRRPFLSANLAPRA
ncbi:hypothetical protein CDD81_1490 [Ophiocordyceps australis]|uniref:Uncharacterized protein n=1 Tax=Ophiocordyceps australis TaxID=1399860 RepID=A0A2C5YDS7_9HYPO|nr:hypothetical protein CDD81_1490 [Ophiocordyceps australis]